MDRTVGPPSSGHSPAREGPEGLEIRPLAETDPPEMAAAFALIGWNKPRSQYERYLVEQQAGTRAILVAWVRGSEPGPGPGPGNRRDVFAGYVTIRWTSDYGPYRDEEIPEIQDLNVLPHHRRRGIATCLLEHAEKKVAERSAVAGIGVGMTADYGAAQRLYVLRGYIPDGRGLMHRGRPLRYGEAAPVDDDLVLYFRRRLR